MNVGLAAAVWQLSGEDGQEVAELLLAGERVGEKQVDWIVYGLMVLTLRGGRVAAITGFPDTGVFPHFGLPRMLRE